MKITNKLAEFKQWIIRIVSGSTSNKCKHLNKKEVWREYPDAVIEVSRQIRFKMSNTKGFTEQIELQELREKCKELTLQLNIAKTYFELALDRADPYPAIKDGLSRVNCALGHEA